MNIFKIIENVLKDLKLSLQNHRGLSVFAEEKAKFEGWVKVELCSIFLQRGLIPVPEKNRVDIVVNNDTAVEIKTVNTNYNFAGVKNKRKPFTKNINSVVKDIEKLRKFKYKFKIVLFIIFPCEIKNSPWQKDFAKTTKELSILLVEEFIFSGDNKIPGVICAGLVAEECEFCRVNSFVKITDDNIKLCNFCYSKISNKCNVC